MLVGDQEEIVFITSPFLPRTFHLPLHFYDVFAQDEAGIQEGLQNPRRDWDEVLVPAGVAHKDSAVLAGLEHAVAFLRYLPHFLDERFVLSSPKSLDPL